MDSESTSENDVPTLESVCTNIAKLKRKIHGKTIIMIRNTIGDIKGMNGCQIYIKFKSVVMNLDGHILPKESLWSMVCLEFFMPHSIDWSVKSRLEKVTEIRDFVMEIESALNANESKVNECNEFIENDIKDEES